MNFHSTGLVIGLAMALGFSGMAMAEGGVISPQVNHETPQSNEQAASKTSTAQSGTKQQTGAEKNPKTLKAVVISAQVGTNIIGVAPVGTEAINLDRTDILKAGATDINSLMLTLPQVSNSSPIGSAREGGTAAYGSANGGGNPTQGTAINLRGLGPGATLLLVDGHRVTSTGTATQFTEASQLPLAALQGVQVMDSGGSALYGSDAVGGVVDFVTRKDVNGIYVAPRVKWANGHHEWDVSLVGGHTWSSLGSMGKGNFMIAVGYARRSAMLSSASRYLSDDLTGLGGVNNEIRGSAITTGAINGGVGPGQPGTQGSPSGNTGPIANPGATGNIAWCDNYVGGACLSGTYLYRGLVAGGPAKPSYSGTSAQPSLSDRAQYDDFLGLLKREQFDVFYNQQINDRVSVDFIGLWTHRATTSNATQYSGNTKPVVTVEPGSPYYITPPGPAGGPMTIDFSQAGMPLFTTFNRDRNWTAIAGLHTRLWGDWHADLSLTYGEDVSCGECQPTGVDAGALQYAVDTGAINPLSTAPLTPSQLAMFIGNNQQVGKFNFQDDVLKLSGTLFHLPSGAVKAAVGTEFIRETEHIANGASRTNEPAFGIFESSLPPPAGVEGVGCTAPLPCPPRTEPNQFAYDNLDSTSRNVHSGFAELYVPLVSAEQQIPFVHSLVLDLAARYDHYSKFGATTNPKFSFTWALSRDVSVLGSWGKSFVAPNLVQNNPFVFSVKAYAPGIPNLTGDPAISGNVPGLVNVGFMLGNPSDLQPETAKSWSLGLKLTPRGVPGLIIKPTYYQIKFKNVILGVNAFPSALFSPSGLATFKQFVHPVHNPSDCNATNKHYDPALLPFINAVGIYGVVPPADFCNINVWIDDRSANVGTLEQNGVDLDTNYEFGTSAGYWKFAINATKVTSESLSLIPGQPATSILGSVRQGGLVPWRARASVTWSKGPLIATLFGNYTGPYTNDNPLFGRSNSHISSWTTFDFNLLFQIGYFSVPNWAANSSVALHIGNVFDRDPPLVLTAAGQAFDANNANIFGRIVSLQLRYNFL